MIELPTIPPVFHGETKPRGLEQPPRVEDISYEGKFGRLFRELKPADFPPEVLQDLAESMKDRSVPTWNASAGPQDGDNAGLPAGYTYVGQFIDHDLTFDPTSSIGREEDPFGLLNFRTPRYDLDSLYGSGPRAHPFLYEKRVDPPRLLLEPNDAGELDLPRTFQQVAVTGDPRNDENKIVSQMQVLFSRLHNRFLQDAPGDTAGDKWLHARRQLRWHYQWVVVHDFLRRLVGTALLDTVLVRDAATGGFRPDLRFFAWRRAPFIPVEFSAAAYRFGHSQVRADYRLNATLEPCRSSRRVATRTRSSTWVGSVPCPRTGPSTGRCSSPSTVLRRSSAAGSTPS